MVIPLSQVIPSQQSISRRDIAVMQRVLTAQGQIEPLQVKPYSTNADGVTTYITFYQDVHASDILAAAHNLNWPTILVCVKSAHDKYEY